MLIHLDTYENADWIKAVGWDFFVRVNGKLTKVDDFPKFLAFLGISETISDREKLGIIFNWLYHHPTLAQGTPPKIKKGILNLIKRVNPNVVAKTNQKASTKQRTNH